MHACPSKHAAMNNAGTCRFPAKGIARTVPILLVLFFLMAPPLQADGNRVAVSFIPGVPGIAEAAEQGGMFWLGVDMKIKEGWHIYWRNPGDSGLPTTIRWNPHPGLNPGEIHWPRPSRFDEDGITTYGYSDRVTLLVPVSLSQNGSQQGHGATGEATGDTYGGPFMGTSGKTSVFAAGNGKENRSRKGTGVSEQPLTASLNWLVCKDICLPESATVSMAIGEGGLFEGFSTGGADRITRSMDMVPDTAEEWQGQAVLVDGRFEITLKPQGANAAFPDEQDIYFYPDRQGLIEHTAPQEIYRHDDKLTIGIPVSRYLRSAPEEISGVVAAKGSWLRDRNKPAIEVVFPVTVRESGN